MSSIPPKRYLKHTNARGGNSATACLLFLLLISLAYGNTLDASWHLDDYHNITQERALHIQELTPSALLGTFFRTTDDGPALNRPFVRLTFALNWYFDRNSVFYYHVVNIVLHWMTACLLFVTCRRLLSLRTTTPSGPMDRYGIALVAALLWCLNPIQTQAVTYIVQRMTVIAAMFFLAAIWFYIKGRQSRAGMAAVAHFSGMALCFLLAIGSKENAVVLPLALLLVEWCFFQDLNSPRKHRQIWLAAGAAIILVVCIGTGTYLVLQKGTYGGFLEAYNERPFTLGQRLLTEPRIVVAYLGQIFYPAPWRLSIEHDVVLSTSLWQPWTTLPAILLLCILAVASLTQIRIRPLLAFGVLFFLLNHSVESTILPLELVFEHRNYLPSMFLFLPLVAGLMTWVNNRGGNSAAPKVIVYGLAACVVSLAATGTYMRNAVWKSERTLWEDVLTKVPDSGRAYHNLAWGYYQKNRQYDQAIAYYRKALEVSGDHSSRQAAATQFNIGLLLMQKEDFTSAARYFAAASEARPDSFKPSYFHAVVLSSDGRYDEAKKIIGRLNAKLPANVAVLNLKALNALRCSNIREAIETLEMSLQADPKNWQTSYYMGAALSAMGDVHNAERFLEEAHGLRPGEPLVWLPRIQNYHDAGEQKAMADAIEQFCGSSTVNDVQKRVYELTRGPFAAPIDTERVLALIHGSKAPSVSIDPDE
jgi:tetratricopeptide (TPR) repeat protein